MNLKSDQNIEYHVAKMQDYRLAIIANNVYVRPGAMIYATKLKDYTIIGICDQVLMDLRFDINSLVRRKYERPKKNNHHQLLPFSIEFFRNYSYY